MPANGLYFDNTEPEIYFDEDNPNPSDNLEEYGIFSDIDVRFIENSVDEAYQTGRAVVFSMAGTGLGDVGSISGAGLKNPKGIRRVEEWYIAPIAFPEYVKEVFDRQTDIALINLQKVKDTCGDKIDVVYICGADFAHQYGQFWSPQQIREIYQPYYRKVNDWIHTNTKWKTFKHSCGAVEPLIQCWIDSGFDILNPIQCSAAGMNPVMLKTKYGRDITFWGGGADTQDVLPHGTTEEVRKQVLKRCEIFGKDGGYIFNAVHNIQKDVPTENIVAMIDALKEFNGE
jgi:uroporphyrinogen-III decarboxylase